ncbi:MAG: 50S ribosomal protein L23 [Planctomycetota bacterium]|jgi:large subunit ribosomal protein L23|nr:50S ribosomal protein L23 [Planctomycetota bacterium]
MTSMERFYRLTSSPILTEKGSDDMGRRNAYHFRVPPDAGKVEIRQAVEKVFDVKVQAVNTSTVRGKDRRRGWAKGKRPDWKKAMVVLHPEHSLDLF